MPTPASNASGRRMSAPRQKKVDEASRLFTGKEQRRDAAATILCKSFPSLMFFSKYNHFNSPSGRFCHTFEKTKNLIVESGQTHLSVSAVARKGDRTNFFISVPLEGPR
jgi:hypothetical protein